MYFKCLWGVLFLWFYKINRWYYVVHNDLKSFFKFSFFRRGDTERSHIFWVHMKRLYFYKFIKLTDGIVNTLSQKFFTEGGQGLMYFKCLWRGLFLWLYKINRRYCILHKWSKKFLEFHFYGRGGPPGTRVF